MNIQNLKKWVRQAINKGGHGHVVCLGCKYAKPHLPEPGQCEDCCAAWRKFNNRPIEYMEKPYRETGGL